MRYNKLVFICFSKHDRWNKQLEKMCIIYSKWSHREKKTLVNQSSSFCCITHTRILFQIDEQDGRMEGPCSTCLRQFIDWYYVHAKHENQCLIMAGSMGDIRVSIKFIYSYKMLAFHKSHTCTCLWRWVNYVGLVASVYDLLRITPHKWQFIVSDLLDGNSEVVPFLGFTY